MSCDDKYAAQRNRCRSGIDQCAPPTGRVLDLVGDMFAGRNSGPAPPESGTGHAHADALKPAHRPRHHLRQHA